jgi:hypothetical protein
VHRHLVVDRLRDPVNRNREPLAGIGTHDRGIPLGIHDCNRARILVSDGHASNDARIKSLFADLHQRHSKLLALAALLALLLSSSLF